MTEQELQALAAKEGISVEELRALLKKGKAQTSSLKERQAKQEAFMGRSMKSDHKRPVANRTAESAAAFNKKQSDFNEWQRQRGQEREEDRKSKEQEQTNKMISHIHQATDKAARIGAPIMMAAATAGAAPTFDAFANSVYNGVNYANKGWQLWNASHPAGSMIANAAFTGTALGQMAGENGVAKTQRAYDEGRYGDAALSFAGDLWNGAVAAQGLYNFGNQLGNIVGQIPNVTDIANIPDDAVIFDPRHPIDLPYAPKAYGVPEILPESRVPGAPVVTRPTSYAAPTRQTGLNGYNGQFQWRATTQPPPVSTNSQPVRGNFKTPSVAPETMPVLPYGSTLPPVLGLPEGTVPQGRTPMIEIEPGYPQAQIWAPSYYSAEVHDPGFESWWRQNYQPGDTGYWNGKPILFEMDPRAWRNDSDGSSLVSPNYRGEDSGDYRYYNEHNGGVVEEDTGNWSNNENKAKSVKSKAEASGETRIRHK